MKRTENSNTSDINDQTTGPSKRSISGYLRIARFDHWVKNVFVLPGILVGVSMSPDSVDLTRLALNVALGLLATGFIASSNYVLNEILDAPFDRWHPTKRHRPIPSGEVIIPVAYAEWLALLVVGIAPAWIVSKTLMITLFALWIMGIVYNVKPIRSKDLPYVDVLSESFNNPLRFLIGWFIVGPSTVPPVSLLVSYWMVGCYFMAIKRFAEFKDIGLRKLAESYRRSFVFYDERRLIVSIMFYASVAMLFFGAFIVRYRLELVLSFPFVALVMATYLSLAFKKGSAAQAPEKLYRESGLMASIVLCTLVIGALLFVDIPLLYKVFPASIRSLSDFVRLPR